MAELQNLPHGPNSMKAFDSNWTTSPHRHDSPVYSDDEPCFVFLQKRTEAQILGREQAHSSVETIYCNMTGDKASESVYILQRTFMLG